MRYSSILLALPALSLAQEQVPLADKIKGWFNKAQSLIPTSVPTIIPDVVDAGASKVAQQYVHPLNLSNWKEVISPSAAAQNAGPEEWMVFITGGNKTCYGLCGNVTEEWNKSVALMEATRSPPNLARVDCDEEQVLCNVWSAGPPSILHILLPKPLADQSKPATTVRFIQLNKTSSTASEIAELHTKAKYLDTPPYEGYWHPFDGILATTGANLPLAYAMWAMAKMPSWLPMILISLLSRSFMGRRMPQAGGQAGGAAPAPAPQ